RVVAPYRISGVILQGSEARNRNKSVNETLLGFSSRLKSNESRIRRNSPTNDVVSKNITIILENLLKNYESSQLPSHGKGQPTVVQTNILIRSMGPLSELDMEYSMDCYFRQYWRDQRLSFVGPIKSLSLSIKMLERIWRPDTYFYNGKNSYVHTITVPNKLLRISQDGGILYSMRLTIKAKCPMELKSFPMDRQSCPLILATYAYTSRDLVYQWQSKRSVNFVAGMTLSQFDLMSYPSRNFTFKRREGEFSVLEVSFNLQRHTGYFLIQVYVPCILIVVLSWVSFWIHREATSDRVGLGENNLSSATSRWLASNIFRHHHRAHSINNQSGFPDGFTESSLCYSSGLVPPHELPLLHCHFIGVHYFTKVPSGFLVGSGEIPIDEDDWEDCEEPAEEFVGRSAADLLETVNVDSRRRRSSIVCPIYNTASLYQSPRRTSLISNPHSSPPVRTTVEKTTQTEYKPPKWKQFLYCLKGDDKFRRQRQREAAALGWWDELFLPFNTSQMYTERFKINFLAFLG
ncbi:hypothetical protein YQE_00390, partial [Dendroctonus ponderosae]